MKSKNTTSDSGVTMGGIDLAQLRLLHDVERVINSLENKETKEVRDGNTNQESK